MFYQHHLGKTNLPTNLLSFQLRGRIYKTKQTKTTSKVPMGRHNIFVCPRIKKNWPMRGYFSFVSSFVVWKSDRTIQSLFSRHFGYLRPPVYVPRQPLLCFAHIDDNLPCYMCFLKIIRNKLISFHRKIAKQLASLFLMRWF